MFNIPGFALCEFAPSVNSKGAWHVQYTNCYGEVEILTIGKLNERGNVPAAPMILQPEDVINLIPGDTVTCYGGVAKDDVPPSNEEMFIRAIMDAMNSPGYPRIMEEDFEKADWSLLDPEED